MACLRVLIVDDDAGVRRTLADALEASADMQVVGSAATLVDGRRLLDDTRPDILLVDLGLPDGSGLTLIRHALARLPECDVMVVSVFCDESSVLASIEAGATGYLLKDASAADIVGQVRVLHAGGSPISPVIARQLLRRFGVAPPAVRTTTPVAAADENALSLREAEENALSLCEAEGNALSLREREVLQLSAKGYSYEEIAPLLGLSRHTVNSFVKRIYRKLQVHSKCEALFVARGRGLLPHD